jgi:serine/threonine protein kinase
MAHGQLLDLVCGPTSPLPETFQRYRLVAHIGSGGQAEVYRAVRLCGGVTSAPMTVKVFRIDPRRPLVDELRSWDKGDAALMDLNNRGVVGICRRADGFYGPPPHRSGDYAGSRGKAARGDAVPYQVYDYLHGINLREYVATKAGLSGAPGTRRLNAVAALRTLAGVLRALHHPGEVGATPVLHMDVKPSNLMVLTNGEVRLIDFTGARYWRHEEITQIAYTPEAGGPEAFGGVSQVSPAYDVHGYGAVAYFLVTGAYPRVEGSRSAEGGRPLDVPPPPWSVLRRNPMLEGVPALRDHLHAPVADRPADRPSTLELPGWVDRLAELVRRTRVPDIGVDWTEPAGASTPRVVARAAVAGTETGAFQRIERLERELVELRAAVAPAANGSVPPAEPPKTMVAEGGRPQPEPGVGAGEHVPGLTAESAVAGAPAVAAPATPDGQIRGRAKVPAQPKPAERSELVVDPTSADHEPWRPAVRRDELSTLKLGWELSATGAIFAFVCWGVWAASNRGKLLVPLLAFCLVLAVAVGVFAICRLLGRLVLVQRLGRVRRSAKAAHAITGLFLAGAGVAYLRSTTWVVDLFTWLHGNG